MYFLIVAMLMLPGGAKDTTNFTAVPFETMAECEMYLHNPNNKIMLEGSLKQYLKILVCLDWAKIKSGSNLMF